MNENKIAVIIPVTSENNYNELVASLSKCRLSADWEIELVRIDHASDNIVKAYQRGMESTAARYKIYLLDTVRIIDYGILNKIIDIFTANPSIAMVGNSGSEILPTSGVGLESKKRYGTLKSASNVLQGQPSEKLYQEVMALDAGFIATVYDIDWNTLDYKNPLFAINSRCIDYKRLGYSVAAIAKEAAIEYAESDMSYNKSEQQAFLNKYSADIFPLVTVLMPTYNRPEYFKIALDSVLNQTYRHLEIIVSDDSDNDITEKLIAPYLARDKRIKYIHHKNFTFFDNWRYLMSYNNPQAEYVNWLMDDDAWYENKIAVMMNYYLFDEGITMVTSCRTIIDAEGNVLPHDSVPGSEPLVKEVTRLSGDTVGHMMISRTLNFIGEPSTVLVAKKNLKNNYWGWNKMPVEYMLGDYPIWLNLASKGDTIYIPDELCYFRSHAAQDQQNIITRLRCTLCYAISAHYAYRHGLFWKNKDEYIDSIHILAVWILNTIHQISKLDIDCDKKLMKKALIYAKSFIKTVGNYCVEKN